MPPITNDTPPSLPHPAHTNTLSYYRLFLTLTRFHLPSSVLETSWHEVSTHSAISTHTHFITSPSRTSATCPRLSCLNLTSQKCNRSGKQFACKKHKRSDVGKRQLTQRDFKARIGGWEQGKRHTGLQAGTIDGLEAGEWVPQCDPPWAAASTYTARQPQACQAPSKSRSNCGRPTATAAAAAATIARLTALSCVPPAGGGARRLPPCGAARRP